MHACDLTASIVINLNIAGNTSPTEITMNTLFMQRLQVIERKEKLT